MVSENQIRGYLFEGFVKKALIKTGYDTEEYDIFGRSGYKHQIDAFGNWGVSVPFVYPIRLITEAKWYKQDSNNNGKASISVVRDFNGVLTDIEQKFKLEPEISKEKFQKRKGDRKTNKGAVFSVNGFTEPAQKYSLTHGIFLVSVEVMMNIKWTKDILDDLNDLIGTVKNKYQNSDRNYRNISLDVAVEKIEINEGRVFLGMLAGYYPIMLFSKTEIEFQNDWPDVLHAEHTYNDEDNTVLVQEIDHIDEELQFSLPPIEIDRKIQKSKNLYKEGEVNLEEIQLPIRVNSDGGEIRRVFKIRTKKKPFRDIEQENL